MLFDLIRKFSTEMFSKARIKWYQAWHLAKWIETTLRKLLILSERRPNKFDKNSNQSARYFDFRFPRSPNSNFEGKTFNAATVFLK